MHENAIVATPAGAGIVWTLALALAGGTLPVQAQPTAPCPPNPSPRRPRPR